MMSNESRLQPAVPASQRDDELLDSDGSSSWSADDSEGMEGESSEDDFQVCLSKEVCGRAQKRSTDAI